MGTGTAAGRDEHVAAHSAADLPAPAGVAASTPPRRSSSAWPTLGLLVLATVVAIIASVIVQLIAGHLPTSSPTTSPARRVVTTIFTLAVFVPLGASYLMLRTLRWRKAGTVLSWGSVSALITVVIAVPLGGSSLFLNGVSFDQLFRTQYFTRLTDSAALTDMNYAYIQSFYPAGWFWIGGRVANLLGMTGWEALKPYAIGSLAVAAVVAVVLWSRLLRTDQALLVAVASTVVGVSTGAPEPYGAVIALVLPPVLVLTWSGLRARPGRWRASLVGAGLFLGVAATFYTLYLGLATLMVVVMALLATWLARRRHGNAAGVRVLARVAVVAVIAIAIALLVWAPYVVELFGGQKTTNAAQRYLPPYGATFLLPMTAPTVVGALSLIGTVWMVVRARTSVVAQALGIGVLCIYLWLALSLLVIFAHTTLLGFRLGVPLDALLAAAGAMGVIDAAGTAAVWWRTRPVERSVPWRAGVATVGVLCAFSVAQGIPDGVNFEINQAYTDANGHGVRADGGPAGDASFYPALDATLSAQTHKPARDVVVLSTDYKFLSFYPYRGFQMFTPHYANPLADYPDRNAEIARWATASSPADLLHQLDASPWQPPTAFVLRDAGDHYTVGLGRDAFPAYPNVQFYDVTLPKSLFADPAFTTTSVGPFAVIVRKS